jgi:hypothetical protein
VSYAYDRNSGGRAQGIAKIDAAGNGVWRVALDIPEQVEFLHATTGSDGTACFMGSYYNMGQTLNKQNHLLAIAPDGSVRWARRRIHMASSFLNSMRTNLVLREPDALLAVGPAEDSTTLGPLDLTNGAALTADCATSTAYGVSATSIPATMDNATAELEALDGSFLSVSLAASSFAIGMSGACSAP